MLTPYQFASNTPIQAIDLDGLEALWYMYDFPNGVFREVKPVVAGPVSDEVINEHRYYSQTQVDAFNKEVALNKALANAQRSPTLSPTPFTDGSPFTLPIAKQLISTAPMVLEELAEVPMLTYYGVKGYLTGDYTDAQYQAMGLVIPGVSKTCLSSFSDNIKAANRIAKQFNAISKSTMPSAVYKQGDKLPDELKGVMDELDHRNGALYEYSIKDANGSEIEKVYLRHDKAAKYGDGGAGDQTEHINVYKKGDNGVYYDTGQHHYIKED
ncbi:MAG: hypothetical protein R2774_01465 [Saprospiraceae bacterium]